MLAKFGDCQNSPKLAQEKRGTRQQPIWAIECHNDWMFRVAREKVKVQ